MSARSGEEVRRWLQERIGAILNEPPESIRTDYPFADYGLSSIEAVGLAAELERWLGRALSAELLYDLPTIDLLASHVSAEVRSRAEGFDDASGIARAQEPIAIVGIACRFPGAADSDEFWRLLRDGVDGIRRAPPRAQAANGAPRWGGFLDDVAGFDASFFGVSPREAEKMDPQQRLLLELAWEALEDCGRAPSRLAGSDTSVFVGISSNDYGRGLCDADATADAYLVTGNALSIAANRLSYQLDLRGPSIAVDTACSSSLVALHLACQSLWKGESSLALVGGVNLILCDLVSESLQRSGFTAADGRCKAFDARADGYVRAEGAAVVVLERVSAARAHGDAPYAWIRSTAINSNGRSNGLTAPSGPAQESLLRTAYREAGVDPHDVHYVEGHGTGTSLGDAIEVAALARLFEGRAPDVACSIGSVKSNIGHLEAAAGLAGLVKVALALHHREIPASLHVRSANPLLHVDQVPIRIQAQRSPWTASGRPTAGVSSFGFGGTNAHAVLQAADPSPFAHATVTRPLHVLCISARTPDALSDLCRRYRAFLERSEPTLDLADVCYTASVRREHHEHRLTIVCGSIEEAITALARHLDGSREERTIRAEARPTARRELVFALSDAGMLEGEPLPREQVFRSTLESMVAASRRIGSLARDDDVPSLAQRFAVDVAKMRMWRAWGIRPDRVWGTGRGAIAAAHAAGLLDADEGVRMAHIFSSARSTAHDGEADDFVRTLQGRTPTLRLVLATADGVVVEPPCDVVGWRRLVEARPRSSGVPVEPLPEGALVLDICSDRTGDSRDPATACGDDAVLSCLAALHVHGLGVDWPAFWREPRRHTRLPTYPWQRCVYWNQPARAESSREDHPRLGRYSQPRARSHQWEKEMPRDRLTGCARRSSGEVLRWPSSELLESALLAAEIVLGSGALAISDVMFHDGIVAPEGEPVRVQVNFVERADGSGDFRVSTRVSSGPWQSSASGSVAPQSRAHKAGARPEPS